MTTGLRQRRPAGRRARYVDRSGAGAPGPRTLPHLGQLARRLGHRLRPGRRRDRHGRLARAPGLPGVGPLASGSATRSTRWVARHGSDRLLPVLTDGAWVWDAAAGDLDARRLRPPRTRRSPASSPPSPGTWTSSWVRAASAPQRDPRFDEALAELGAPVLAVSKDELVGEDVRRQRRTVRLTRVTAAVLALLTVVAIGSRWVRAVRGRRCATPGGPGRGATQGRRRAAGPGRTGTSRRRQPWTRGARPAGPLRRRVAGPPALRGGVLDRPHRGGARRTAGRGATGRGARVRPGQRPGPRPPGGPRRQRRHVAPGPPRPAVDGLLPGRHGRSPPPTVPASCACGRSSRRSRPWSSRRLGRGPLVWTRDGSLIGIPVGGMVLVVDPSHRQGGRVPPRARRPSSRPGVSEGSSPRARTAWPSYPTRPPGEVAASASTATSTSPVWLRCVSQTTTRSSWSPGSDGEVLRLGPDLGAGVALDVRSRGRGCSTGRTGPGAVSTTSSSTCRRTGSSS